MAVVLIVMVLLLIFVAHSALTWTGAVLFVLGVVIGTNGTEYRYQKLFEGLPGFPASNSKSDA